MRVQAHVALSSADSEFVAMATSCKEVISMKEMCNCLLNKKDAETYGDNKAALKMAMSEESKTFRHMTATRLCNFRLQCLIIIISLIVI